MSPTPSTTNINPTDGVRPVLTRELGRSGPDQRDGVVGGVPVIVAVDVDPDWRLSRKRSVPYSGQMGWDGVRRGLPRLIDILGKSAVPEVKNVRFTWLLRCDLQMADIFSDPAYVAVEFAEFWKARAAAGDEIGWHPHFWRYSQQHRVWFQETKDEDWHRECLKEGYNALSRHYRLRAAKTGWTYQTNPTMRVLSDLGLRYDLSALPGMNYDASIAGSGLPLGVYDWSRAPQEPYHPRHDDYQLPALRHGLTIMEIPNWTFPLGRMRELQHALKMRPRRDFANPAKRAFLVRQGFERPPTTVPFLCYFHPEELLDRSNLFGLRNVETNLTSLVMAIKSRGAEPVMTTPSGLGSGLGV